MTGAKVVDGNDILFSSGNRLHANNCIIGIDDELTISEGYDGGINWPPEGSGPQFTADDMRELADMMIERWTRFKAELP